MITPLHTPRRGAAAAAPSVVLIAGIGVFSPTDATAAAPGTARAAGRTITLPVRDALAQLPIAAEDRTGYKRTAFKHWIDADGDGCDTRKEVLKDEAINPPAQTAGCALTSGEWYSPYDDTYFTDPGDAEEVRRCGAEDADVFCVALVEVVVEGASLKGGLHGRSVPREAA